MTNNIKEFFKTNGKVTHCLIYDKYDKNIDESVRWSTRIFYQRNVYIDPLPDNPKSAIIERTEDEAIVQADKEDFSYLIMTYEGNIFNINFFHEECLKFITETDNSTSGRWLVAGHIMDQYQNRILYNDPFADKWKDSFWLYPITAIINLKVWRELNRPAWGQELGKQLVLKGIPSSECVHDNYTPKTLLPSNQWSTTLTKKGWNIINESLKARIPVLNLSNEIRRSQIHLYPENSPKEYEHFWTSLFNFPKLQDNYKKAFSSIISCKFPERIEPGSGRFFLKNTEEYFPNYGDCVNAEMSQFDTFILPSSGFKDFIVSSKSTLDEPIQILHYDILDECIKIKKEITENWSGTKEHLIQTLETISSKYSNKGKHSCYHFNDLNNFDDVYLLITKFFNNEDEIKNAWLKFQRQTHTYQKGDMLDKNDCFSIIKHIKGKNVYLCLSDIAGWRNNILGYGYKNLRGNISFIVKELLTRGINGVVDYKDPGTDTQYIDSFNECLIRFERPFYQ